MNIYVGNLSFQTTEDELKKLFEVFGQVESVSIIKDKFSGESRGFAFVVMPDQAQARAAIEGCNGKDLSGRALKANEARSQGERSDHGGSGDRGDRGDRRGGGGFGGRRR
jgi:RNA recognition motif-containing protein